MSDSSGAANSAAAPEVGQLIIAQRLDARSLPGTLRKKATIAPGEVGLLVTGGQVKRALGPGDHTLGRSDSLVSINAGPFSLRLNFARLLSGDFESLDAFGDVAVAVEDGGLLYRTSMLGVDLLKVDGLAGILSSTLDQVVQTTASDYEGEVLCQEVSVQQRLSSELEPALRAQLEQRGLRMVSIDALVFRASEEEDRLMVQLEDLRHQVETAERQNWDTVAQVAEHLLQRGLAAPEEVDGVRRDMGGDHKTATASVLALLDSAMARVESHLAQRAENLMGRGSDLEAGIAPTRTEEASMKGLERWGWKKGLKVDETVRLSIGRDLATVTSDIRGLRQQAYRQGLSQIANSLNRLEADVDLFRTEVGRAAFGSTAISRQDAPSRQIMARLIQFEEDMSRQAQSVSLHVEKVRAALSSDGEVDGAVHNLTEVIEGLRRKFSRRAGILEGFKT